MKRWIIGRTGRKKMEVSTGPEETPREEAQIGKGLGACCGGRVLSSHLPSDCCKCGLCLGVVSAGLASDRDGDTSHGRFRWLHCPAVPVAWIRAVSYSKGRRMRTAQMHHSGRQSNLL